MIPRAFWLIIASVLACVASSRAASHTVGTSPANPPHSTDASTTRIVSLVPSLTETLFALGAGDQVVGVSDFCEFPPEARSRPHLGGLINPNLEALLRLRPDLVLLYRSQADFSGKLHQLGIKSELFQVDTLADLYAAVDRLGIATGKTSAAAAMAAQIRSRLAALRTDGPAVRGVVIVSRDPGGLRAMYQAARGNFLGQIFELAGGELALPENAPVTAEQIIRANPDLIIDFSYAAGEDATGPVDDQKDSATSTSTTLPARYPGPWSRLNTVKAVKAGNVYRWANPHALLPGPHVADTAQKMKAIIDQARRPGINSKSP